MRGVAERTIEWWRCYSRWDKPCEFVGRACFHCGRLTSMDLIHAQKKGLDKTMTTPAEPMTTGKGKLKHQIRELEGEIERLKNSPLQLEVARLQGELQKLQIELNMLRSYCSMIELRAEALVKAALELAQTINLSDPNTQLVPPEIRPIARRGEEVKML